MFEESNFQSSELDNPNILYQLLVDWYGTIHFNRSLTSTELMRQWTLVWFAKGEQQIQIDQHFQIYKSSMEHFVNFKCVCLDEKIALILLYDQITRNIYRSTENAYKYDKIAQNLALEIVENNSLSKLSIQYLISIVICLIHSEELKDLDLARILIDRYIVKHPSIDPQLLESLKGIATNHTDRLRLFGRIPERNRWIGRQSTQAEIIYMKSIK